MDKIGKASALLLTFIIALSGLTLFTVKPTSAQSITTPSVPTFSLKFVDDSYNIPPTTTTTTDPYTGKLTTTTTAERYVENKTIELIIKNQPLNQDSYNLYYYIRTKGHFEENWTSEPIPPDSSGSIQNFYYLDTNNNFAVPLVTQQSNSSVTIVTYPANSANYPAGSNVDFQVEAVSGFLNKTYNHSHIGPPLIQNVTFYYSTSALSNTQTIAIPSSSALPNEITLIIIGVVVVLAVLVTVVALIINHRKSTNLKQ